MKQEHLYAIALTRIGGFNLPALMELGQHSAFCRTRTAIRRAEQHRSALP